ncbi:hypothetical protein [Pararhodobacter sp.]|uniref:hypothetical protein n=1 Tax=Pararhodobacter sp. TaxID=2127056 RepID=UPI002AFDDDBB|nr:hypothetical protein [Pararhodobacter sp.]
MAMTAEDFEAWLDLRGISGREAARQLGVSNDTITKYKRQGAPLYIALACSALCHGLPPWRKVANHDDD